MSTLRFRIGELSVEEQRIVSAGFDRHSKGAQAPHYESVRLNWLSYDSADTLVGAATANLLWDWIYIDELWVDESQRGTGLGKQLMQQVEAYATTNNCTGLWLWTQSWQAAEFYKHLGYQEFTRFDDFPKGHARIGFRKLVPV